MNPLHVIASPAIVFLAIGALPAFGAYWLGWIERGELSPRVVGRAAVLVTVLAFSLVAWDIVASTW